MRTVRARILLQPADEKKRRLLCGATGNNELGMAGRRLAIEPSRRSRY
jgi:hypothetical protein